MVQCSAVFLSSLKMNFIEREAKEAYVAQQSDRSLFSDSESESDTIPLQNIANSKALSRKKYNAVFHDSSDSEVNKGKLKVCSSRETKT